MLSSNEFTPAHAHVSALPPSHFEPRSIKTTVTIHGRATPTHTATATVVVLAAVPRSRRFLASWRALWVLIRRMLELSLISNVAAAFCALYYGWANPFLRDFHAENAATRTRAALATAVLLTAYMSVLGMAASCLLLSFFIQGRRRLQHPNRVLLSIPRSVWITCRLTWRSALALTVVGVTTTMALALVDFPVVKFNCHTLIAITGVATHAGQAIIQIARFRRQGTASFSGRMLLWPRTRSVAATATNQVSVVPIGLDGSPSPSRSQSQSQSQLPPQRRRRSSHRAAWRKVVRVALTNVLPTLLASVLGTLYVSTARQLDLRDRGALLAFGVGSVMLKLLLQMVAKLVAGNTRGRDGSKNYTRNLLYIITSPILIIEINVRLAMLRVTSASGTNVALYAGVALLGGLEIGARVFTVALDLLVIVVASRKLHRRKCELRRAWEHQRTHAHDQELQQHHHQELQQQLALKIHHDRALAAQDERFAAWKTKHLHLCAVESTAEMAAEYCGIGFACVYMIALRNNPVFDLGMATTAVPVDGENATGGWMRFVASQLTTYVVQLGVELFSDLVGSTLEMQMGIRVDRAFDPSELTYIRWTVLVVAIHAGSVSISSLVATTTGS